MGLLYRKGSRAAAAQKIEKELAIVNRLGLHARPAAMFVRIASRHRAEIWVSKEGEEVNGKSIMGLVMLAAGQGSTKRGCRSLRCSSGLPNPLARKTLRFSMRTCSWSRIAR